MRLLAVLAIILLPAVALAKIPEDKIKLGILDDASQLYEHRTTRDVVLAARMAAEDFSARHTGLDVEIDTKNNLQTKDEPGLVRDWIDKEHIDAVLDVAGDAVALSISDMLRQHNRIFAVVNVAGLDFGGGHCSPTTLQWGATPAALSSSLVHALNQLSVRRWFFISGTGALDQAAESDARGTIAAVGGQVIGSVSHPLGAGQNGEGLRKAIAAKPDVIALSETGEGLQGTMRQAAQLGIASGPKIAGLYVEQHDVDGIGLLNAQGLYLATPFYRDRNEASRHFAQRYKARTKTLGPTEIDTEVYSATLALLHAMDKVRSVDGDKVMTALRTAQIPDQLLGTVTVGADGIAAHDMYVVRVKRPDQSLAPGDDYEPVATIPSAQAFPAAPGCTSKPSH